MPEGTIAPPVRGLVVHRLPAALFEAESRREQEPRYGGRAIPGLPTARVQPEPGARQEVAR